MSGHIKSSGVLGKGHWCGLHLSVGNPIGVEGGGPAAAGSGISWDDIGLGKGLRKQNPGKGTVILAGGSLISSAFCNLGM